MALIKCSECGSEISDQANTCPNCGIKIRKDNKKVEKFLIIGIPILIVVFILVAVSIYGANAKPNGMDKDTYNLGISALAITDDYLDAKISSKDAKSKLEDVQSRLDQLYDVKKEPIALSISTYISCITTTMVINTLTPSLGSDATKYRNEIAGFLNKSKR